jgi:hypothetical protein
MMGEIFPSRVRGLASSVATLVNWSCAFAITESFSSMKSAFSESGVFWFYGAICIIGVTYVALLVPETKVCIIYLSISSSLRLSCYAMCGSSNTCRAEP